MTPTSNPEKRPPSLSNAERKCKHRANWSEDKKKNIKEDDRERKK